MKDSFAFGLDMVSDLARNPKFAPEELERQRQQILSGLKVGYEDPDYIAGMVFDRLVYGFHPYGRPDSGTPESIASITRNDLVAFHKAYFGANNAILAIVGDINHEEAFAGAERVFGNWGRAESAIPKPADPPAPTRRACRHRSARSGPDRDPRRQHRACPAATRTTWRSTWRSTFWAARAATGCIACCARIAA